MNLWQMSDTMENTGKESEMKEFWFDRGIQQKSASS